MEERFQECIKFVLARETEYNRDGTAKVERDPSDPGGTTKYGIDQRSHPHVDVANLTKTEAAQIYHDTEWTRARCGELKAPWDLAVFDSAINPGLGWCIPNLQRTVGAVPDGHIGPKTIAAVNASGETELTNFLQARCQYYRDRPEKLRGRPFRARFLGGWLNRVALLAEATLGNEASRKVMFA